MAEDFKFPDEQEETKAEAAPAEEEFEIQIEDDTPEQDRGRKPLPKDLVEELEKDDLEDYSEKVKKRLSQMKKVWHDERREKERAIREREEALRFAQLREQEISKLREDSAKKETAFLKEAARYAEGELARAKELLKQAYDSGDSDLIVQAQEKLTDAKQRQAAVSRIRPPLQKSEESVQNPQQVQSELAAPTPKADPKAEAWREKNTWFGVDEEMTSLAYGLHQKLVRSGVDPSTDEYYRRIDDTMRKRFPEAFDGEEEEEPQTKQEKPARTNKPATVVAPVTRGTAPRQVRLTPSQVAIAKKLGLSNQEYAQAMIELEKNNG